MKRRAIGALALLALTVACGSPVQRAANKLMEQVRLGDPLARQTYEEDKDLLLSPEAVPIWTEALQSSDSPQIKEWAAQLLGDIGDESSLPVLAAALSEPRNVREAAVAAIKQFDDDQACDAFVLALESGELDAQAVALPQISRLKASRAVPAVAIVGRSSDELVSRTAIDTLGDIGDSTAAEALVAMVTDDALQAESRAQALLNLKRIEGAEDQLQAVLAALEESEDETAASLLEQATVQR